MVRLLTLALLTLTIGNQPPARPEQPQCVRLGGSQLGQLPLTVELGGQQIRFLEWKTTDVTARTLIGFQAQASAQIDFTVEAGGTQLAASSNWLHPAGVVGPKVKPIDAITLCLR